MAFSWSLSKHIKISIIYLKRELFVVAPLLAPAAWFQWPAVTSLVWCCSGPITAVQCLPSGAHWRLRLLPATTFTFNKSELWACEHWTMQPGEAASVYNCVEQETLISAGGGKNCQTRAQQSAESSNVDIYLPRYSQYVFDSVCKAVLRTSISISRTDYNRSIS